MAYKFRDSDTSCDTIADNTKKFFQCLRCDDSKTLFMCEECKESGHKNHKIRGVLHEGLNDVKFCNCGDGNGVYFCKDHPKHEYKDGVKPLIFDKSGLNFFEKKFEISHEKAMEISRINQLKIVERKSEEGKLIQNYFDNTNAHNLKEMKIKKCWSVYRKDQETIFVEKGYENTRRMLLWHGTKKENINGILENGFRKPDVKAVKNGSMFGKGIYFADRVSKSAQYCDGEGYGVLFLCEVALGSMWRTGLPKDYSEVPDKFTSIKGVGKNIPDTKEEVKLNKIIVPLGKTIKNTHPKIHLSKLDYNEYIVFDPERILIRYILAFKLDPASCSIQ